ncbi:hypothetical protein JHK82_052330 [Glycine max]|nr:hypothetical protein JHK86_052161 [Glycine max]KAG4926530.1 hypothetical protein JHK85_053016 [Glycine max]KAG5082168.1 hypothetical protein JHK84_052206 [Glycine max]KAG5084933.1 hypothetical protein JHK82_052330 [Glycine max]
MGNSRFALLACKNINYLKLRQSRNLLRGNSTRSTGTRGANEESSRSHAILQLCIKGSADGTKSKPARLVGKLSFIDLAGSERVKSLSKGNTSRRDPLSSSNLRDSAVLPGSSVLSHDDTLEDEVTYVSGDKN